MINLVHKNLYAKWPCLKKLLFTQKNTYKYSALYAYIQLYVHTESTLVRKHEHERHQIKKLNKPATPSKFTVSSAIRGADDPDKE